MARGRGHVAYKKTPPEIKLRVFEFKIFASRS